MPVYSASAQAALLKAVNRVFHLDRTADSLDELADGIILAYVLHELDSEFNPSDLDTTSGTSRYLTNKRNIQTVYKGLFRFIRRQVPELGCQAKKVDYHAIAENPEPQGISQLLAVMISAAAMGPDNQRYVPRIQNGLDRDTQAEIMQIIRTVQQDINASRGDEDLDEAIDAVMEARDVDLLVEEQNASLRQQLDMTKKNLSDYITRLEYLQQSHEELKYEKEKNDRELEVLRKATQDGANSAESIKVLEAQVHEQMEIIARNEEAIRQHDKIRSQLESEVQKLTQKSMQADELRDQVMELKHKAEEFEKKANTADRYKQKLESQQHLNKEVQNLQYERAELQEQLRAVTYDREKDDRTRKAEDELTKMITQSEQHLWDERNQKTQLMKDNASLEEELARLKNQRNHDEHFIQDLQEQLEQGNTSQSAAGTATSTFNLEDELNDASNDDGQINLPLELSRLKAENEMLRSTVGSSGDNAALRKELDDQKRQQNRIQHNFNDIFEKHAVAQDQIEALVNHMTGEGLVNALNEIGANGGLHILTGPYYRTQAFINLRTEHLQSSFELEQSQKQNKDLQALVADQNRELLAARTQLSGLDKGGVEALNDFRNARQLIDESFKAQLESLQEEYKFVVNESDAQKSQLIEALIAKDKFRKKLEEDKDSQDVTTLVSTDPDFVEANKKTSEKVEKLRARLVELKEVSPLARVLAGEKSDDQESGCDELNDQESSEDEGSYASSESEVWPVALSQDGSENPALFVDAETSECFLAEEERSEYFAADDERPDSFAMAEVGMELPAAPPRAIASCLVVRQARPTSSPPASLRTPDWAPGKGHKLRTKWNKLFSFRPWVHAG
ncbi:hypothetical protein G7046_g5541 [Stylonectria norvegica]|nr:hypothetical protein G7046_g5541 [Stylonectria norvegica]